MASTQLRLVVLILCDYMKVNYKAIPMDRQRLFRLSCVGLKAWVIKAANTARVAYPKPKLITISQLAAESLLMAWESGLLPLVCKSREDGSLFESQLMNLVTELGRYYDTLGKK